MYLMTPNYIPVDLQISVLLRLPVKSLYRFRSVSKRWSSIITSRDFRNRHFDIASSSPPPRLLIVFSDVHRKELLVVSTPNPNVSSSSSSSNRDLIQVNVRGNVVYNACRGLICVGTGLENFGCWAYVGAGFENFGIYNPSTRRVHTFRQFKSEQTQRSFPAPVYMLGYDPIEDQYKLLALDYLASILKYKVVVLGGEQAWREAPCVACPHIVCTRGLYMNGTVYYGALREDNDDSIIVSFDVRYETLKIIKVPNNMWAADPMDKTLINYKGTIGVVENPYDQGSFRMWILQDAEKEEWSMNTFSLPESVAGLDFKVMDTSSTCEICLVPKELSDPFCLFYYNLEEKSIRSVTVEGLPISKLKQSRTLSVRVMDHYENSMSLET